MSGFVITQGIGSVRVIRAHLSGGSLVALSVGGEDGETTHRLSIEDAQKLSALLLKVIQPMVKP